MIGHMITDAMGGSMWWSWIIPEGVYGVIVGAFAAKYAVKEGGFGGKAIALFNVMQIIGNAVAWILVAPVLDILIYKEPVNKVFVQGAFAFLGNAIVSAILGTLLCLAYSKIGAKASSLSKED